MIGPRPDPFQSMVDRMVANFETTLLYGPPPVPKKPRMTKKPRRLIVTLELETTLTVSEIRKADRIAIGTFDHGVVWIFREPLSMEHRLLQVQANAITAGKAKRGRK